MSVIPSRSSFSPNEPITVVRSESGGVARLEITHLGTVVADIRIDAADREITLGPLPLGGYGVALTTERGTEWSAFDVVRDPFDRPRYGFVVDMTDGTDRTAVARNFRRNHLNIAQFYDWAYRHSQLMPPSREYLDPLGQPRTLDGVNGLAAALEDSGVVPLGYTAVYGVATDEVERWTGSLLRRSDGEPYQFGDDFLLIVDPAERVWMEHYLDQLAAMLEGTRFAGFHLDQYGWPKRAVRSDGVVVDLAESFVLLIEAIRRRLPDSRFIFNNVNDFPIEATAPAPQDASYIEVWDPHSDLAALGTLALKARALRPDHPPILSAYLSCYSSGDWRGADAAARLTMATIFSHGASHLLLGESGNVLVHAYYPNSLELPAQSSDMFARWYDFLVRYGDLLMVEGQVDVTEQFTGGVNEEFVFDSDSNVVFSTAARPGTVWTRVVRTPNGFVLHLVNLTGQDEITWDAVKNESPPIDGVQLRIIPTRSGQASPRAASPDTSPQLTPLTELDLEVDDINPLSGAQAALSYAVPTLHTWLMIWLQEDAEA